ncbi:hypothetical protein GGX14DRAFT_647533 [Mycena pura]|uniref:Uncharacterized protein n=1 Tax=Mycena pura TaxID=153505 RepID=A0AAD6V8T5_9AGAR|nr:hypothetical protein GGX14DRAFT_647533 [Mycena pura]
MLISGYGFECASLGLDLYDAVVAGSWPCLTTLTLGAFGYDADFALAGPPPGLPAFLARHARVAALRLAWTFRRWTSPDDAAAFAQAALLPAAAPALAEFAGVVQQLPRAAAGACAGITALDLMCEPLYPARAPALCAALGGMPALVSLDLWVHVEPDLDAYRGFMGDLCAAAPGLEDFQFMCTTAFGKKPLTALAYALRGLPRLKSFALTKGHRYTDESMRACSARRAPPRRASRSGAGAAAGGSQGRGRGTGKAKGHEAAVVEAWERGLRAVGGAFERRYRFPLLSILEWGRSRSALVFPLGCNDADDHDVLYCDLDVVTLKHKKRLSVVPVFA